MAKGKPTPASFKKGDPRAVAAGKKSSRALPPEVKEARLLNAAKFEEIIYKYMGSPIEELQAAANNPATPAIEHIVIKLLSLAIKHGDIARLNLLLERTIGKVTDKLQVNAQVTNKTLHQQIVEEIQKHEDPNTGPGLAT